jgi:diguanylate cyclase (GGDEF)-like protein/PAS domain S-box-containing protein
MIQFFLRLSSEHNLRLVLLAAAVGFLTSAVAISLFRRAREATGRARAVWLTVSAAAAGFGIWSTHFIAILSYDSAMGIAYHFSLTLTSLLLAIAITGAGLAIAAQAKTPYGVILGGAIVSCGIVTMHAFGMMALDADIQMEWSPFLIGFAIVSGLGLGGLSLSVATWNRGLLSSLAAALVLVADVLCLHFIAMSAMTMIRGDAALTAHPELSRTSLSILLAGCAAVFSGMCLIAVFADRQARQKLQRQKILLAAAIDNISQGLCMHDATGRIMLFNERYSKMVGRPAADLRGQTLLDLLKERQACGDFDTDPEAYLDGLMANLRKGESSTRIWETSNGRTLRVVDHPIKGENGNWVSTIEDITDWREAQAQIAHMAHHDALTDLPNRTLFHEQLEAALARLERNERVAVLCIDLDRFKDVNDSLGHPVGDQLLREVTQRLIGCVRKGDTVARLGGDEFAIVLAGGAPQAADIAVLVTRLVETVALPYEINGNQIVVGASVGISVAPDDGTDPDQLLKNADMAMYRAKADGRGTYRFFEPGMDAQAQARRLLMIDLRAALLRQELDVYYQPVLDLDADEIVSFEALVRWKHPIRGIILPNDFIPLAEETGLIIPIGDWVLRRACMDAVRWPANISVAVNLSPAQFRNRALCASIFEAVQTSGLAPERLELEITETVLLQDSEATLSVLHKLRDFGIRISMDDFGTGYSSLSYLRSFPFDKIKIDQSFVRDLGAHGDSMAIVRAVAGLGKSLRIKTTAEGVETLEQLALLRAEGCTQMQGYLFGRPQPASEIAELLANHRLHSVA